MTSIEFKEARETKGYSRREIAACLGRHPDSIRNWEKGRSPVPKFASDWLDKADPKA